MGKRVCPKCGAVEDEDTYRRYQARIETAERELEATKKAKAENDERFQLRVKAAARERDNAVFYEGRTAAKLAAVRERSEAVLKSRSRAPRGREFARSILAILDGEGEKCPTCGGTDPEGGTVATMGPDEFGNYETDDCEDEWHGEQK